MYAPGNPPYYAMVSWVIPNPSFPASLTRSLGFPASGAWANGVNAALYYPLLIPTTCVVRRMWWVNGATVNASYNIDAGVYADGGYRPGARLVSTGSTAQGTASQVQFAEVTDTTIGPGLYWIGMSCSSASATFFRSNLSTSTDIAYRFEEASALPLPATATPVESTTESLVAVGFATTASP